MFHSTVGHAFVRGDQVLFFENNKRHGKFWRCIGPFARFRGSTLAHYDITIDFIDDLLFFVMYDRHICTSTGPIYVDSENDKAHHDGGIQPISSMGHRIQMRCVSSSRA